MLAPMARPLLSIFLAIFSPCPSLEENQLSLQKEWRSTRILNSVRMELRFYLFPIEAVVRTSGGSHSTKTIPYKLPKAVLIISNQLSGHRMEII